MKWIACLALASMVGCAALQRGDAPPPQDVVEEDEDAGVEAIARMLREVRKHLSKKRFEDATRLVVRAERAVKKATDLTRAHPDFDDIAEAVTGGRAKLEAAIEQDRVDRRETAIDDLMRRAETAIRQGATLHHELKVRVPAPEDIESLAEIVGTLNELRGEGGEFLAEARYKEHAANRDQQTETLVERLAQARWQRKAGKAVSDHIDEAHRAASAIKAAESSSERTLAFQKAASSFTSCVNTISDLEDELEYEGEWLIETRLGTRTIAKTKRLCTERSARARKEGYKLDWHNKVLDVVASLAEPVPRARAGGRASVALESSEDALNALSACESILDKTARHPGADNRKTFESILGKLNVSQLKQACIAERARLSRALPGLRWRGALEEIGDRVSETKRQMDQAHLAKNPDDRIKRWQGVIGGLKECVEQVRGAVRERGAEKSFAVITGFGKLTAGGMDTECNKQLEPAKKQLTLATLEAELAKFLVTCRGDEVAVARREGIPARIQNVEGGRLFVYQKRVKGRKTTAQTFGFDTTGKRVDFRLKWLNQVGTVVSEVNRSLQAIARAPNGTEALKATEAVLPALGKCVEALKDSDKSPGYDGSAVFTTSLGKVPAAKLAELCGAERVKRAGNMVGLKWRIRLESLRDRVGEAQTELERGKAAGDATAKTERIGAAIGGFDECVERVDSLGKAEGANAKLKVKTAFGDQNLRAILRSCQGQLKSAKTELDKATAEKARDDFVESCRGDEAEVARRRGIPSRLGPSPKPANRCRPTVCARTHAASLCTPMISIIAALELVAAQQPQAHSWRKPLLLNSLRNRRAVVGLATGLSGRQSRGPPMDGGLHVACHVV